MAATEAEIEEFLAGPLVAWLTKCVKKPETLQIYETFYDGSPISEVLLQIDPEPIQPIPNCTNLPGLTITSSRVKIFHSIISNIKAIYEEEFGQTVVYLPDCVCLGRTPGSKTALEQMNLLLLLLLGCAIQGPTKEMFIARIKELPIPTQHQIVKCITEVTDDQCFVLTVDWQSQNAEKLYMHLRNLTSTRDRLFHQWISDIGQESHISTGNEGVESNHLAVELADWKARLRKQRQELEEKIELLTECREELEQVNETVTKLKSENAELLVEARKAKSYRDEMDAMREKAERADKLENEVQRFRERLADAEYYKVRVDELREDNRVLIETREMLESQLTRARQRADRMLELESELLNYKQKVNDLTLEKDAAKEKITELNHENFQLQQVTKSALQETSLSNAAIDSDYEENFSEENSISEQLTNTAQTRALKLELENRKLLSTIDSLKENSFHESSVRILELEKEKKILTLKLDQLQDNNTQLAQQNSELEEIFKNALLENRKLQDSLDSSKVISDRQNLDLQIEKQKIVNLDNNIESLNKEKQRIQSLCDTIRKRADDSEKSLAKALEQIQTLQLQTEQNKATEKERDELQNKVSLLEKENTSMQKEVTKLKESLETKEQLLDVQSGSLEKQIKELAELHKEKEALSAQIEKLQDLEQRYQDLFSQTSVHCETLTTLQDDLVTQKLINEKLKTSMEKFGLNQDVLEGDVKVFVDKLLNHLELRKEIMSVIKEKQLLEDGAETSNVSDAAQETDDETQIKFEKLIAEMSVIYQQNETLQAENAKMQVDVSTVSSQINSLTIQQTALQLANSQLVAEKEEMSKQQKAQRIEHDTLLKDQLTIRSLHEQLNAEYDELKRDQENYKKLNRDLRFEIRSLKDTNVSLEKKIITLEHEKDALKNESNSLGNLRSEHSKLKDDFRYLFTTNERLKSEYRSIQEEYKNLKSESSRLMLNNTEMQGEFNSQADTVASLQLENAKLLQKCDMLFNMNHSLDSDRRKLMEHVSVILGQYQGLLSNFLDDKEHYHEEEKMLNDRVNNLTRQKEKLEEKIMEHYKKLDNASKKKGFGATLVRKVRKAGSDIINKVPTRNRRSWNEESRMCQSQYNLATGSAESGGNDSDNSNEDTSLKPEAFIRSSSSQLASTPKDEPAAFRRSRRENYSFRNSIAGDQVYSRETTGSALSLGSVGTRRTVYLSEDDPATPTPPNQSAPPLLVYNRISTVIGGGETAKNSQQQMPTNLPEEPARGENSDKKKETTKENAIWYEYGCV